MAQIGHLFLGGKQGLFHPLRHVNAPLQPHPSIVDIPLYPQLGPVNDGWEENQDKHVSKNANCLNIHEKQPQPGLVVAPIGTSTNSFSKNNHFIEMKSYSLKLLANEKGKKPMDKFSIFESSNSCFVHSKESTKELQGYNKKEIYHVDMFPKIYPETLCL